LPSVPPTPFFSGFFFVGGGGGWETLSLFTPLPVVQPHFGGVNPKFFSWVNPRPPPSRFIFFFFVIYSKQKQLPSQLFPTPPNQQFFHPRITSVFPQPKKRSLFFNKTDLFFLKVRIWDCFCPLPPTFVFFAPVPPFLFLSCGRGRTFFLRVGGKFRVCFFRGIFSYPPNPDFLFGFLSPR